MKNATAAALNFADLPRYREPYTDPPIRALRGCDVYGPMSKTGLSRSEVYRLIALGEFPAGFLVAKNSRAWFEHEVDHWLLERARRFPAASKTETTDTQDPQ